MSAAAPTARRPLLDLGELPRAGAEHAAARARRRQIVLSATQARAAALVALVALIGVAAGLRLHALAAQSLWFDEGLSQWGAHRSPDEIVRWLIHASVHPPLYFLYLHMWIKLGGDSVWWMRLSSAIPSVLTLLPMYGLGRRLHSRRAGLIAVGIAAVSPFFVYYGQDLRMYALFGFAATTASYCLVWGLQSQRRLPWACYALAATATVYLHNVGLAILLAHAVIVITAWLGANPAGRRGAVAVAAALAAWLPWMPVALGQRGGKGGSLSWITNPDTGRVADLLRTFVSDMLPPHIRVAGSELPLNGVRVLLVAVSLMLVISGLVALRRRSGALLIGSALLLGPFVLALDAGVTQPVFLDRTLLPVAVLYILMMAVGCASVARRRNGPVLVAGLLALMLVVSALGLSSYWNLRDGRDINEPWNRAAALVAAYQRPGDVMLFRTGSAALPFGYYYDRTGVKPLPQYGTPCPWLAVCPGAPSLALNHAWMAARVLPYRRLWVVKRWYGNWDFDLPQAIGFQPATRFERLGEQNFSDGVVVRLYQRIGPSALPRRTARLARDAETPAAMREASRWVPRFSDGPPPASRLIAVSEAILLVVGGGWWVGGRVGRLRRRRRRQDGATAGSARPAAAPQLIDLNRASITELMRLPSVGRMAAERIVSHREQAGPYRSPHDLAAVEGFHSERVRRVAERARV